MPWWIEPFLFAMGSLLFPIVFGLIMAVCIDSAFKLVDIIKEKKEKKKNTK